MNEAQKLLKSGRAVFGYNAVLGKLKAGKIEEVYISNNCPDEMKVQIEKFAKTANIKVVALAENNEEFGALLKKHFSVSVAGLQKHKEK